MSRQIHPGIFGDEGVGAFVEKANLETLPLFDAAEPGLSYEELTQNIDKLRYEAQEWVKSLGLRLDKTHQRINQNEEKLKQVTQETNERFTYIANRLKEKQTNESKIEALLARHNQIVQNFELRLTQAQRLIENQSLQLAKQQDAIDEARRQLERLKRL